MHIKTIVIGGNHHNTLGVIRSLGYKGLSPHVIVITNHKKPYVCYSKYLHSYKILKSPDEIVDYLLDIKAEHSKPVIISCADFVTAVLDTHHVNLSKYYHLPVGNGNIERVMDKNLMAKIANECDIYTPRCLSVSEISFDNGQKYFIKPQKSIEGSKSDIAVIRNKEQLDSFLKSANCNNLQIQSFVEKDCEFQLIGCSLNGGEIVIIPGVSIILRQPENTNTGFLKYVNLSEFHYDNLEACKKFIQTIGYSGLFSMEFLRGKDGKDYFMEINMRNDGNSICVTAAGINLPYIWYCYSSGLEEWTKEATNIILETIVMPEFDDFINVIKRKISLLQWIRDIRQTNCFMEYDPTDLKPFFVGLNQQVSNYLKLILRKLIPLK